MRISVEAQVLILCKEPVAGAVKTRLTPALTPDHAASVAAAALADTIDAVASAGVVRRVLVVAGSPHAPEFDAAGFDRIEQRGGPLDERLAAAFVDAESSSPRPLPMLLIGMDTPQLTAAMIERACAALLRPGTDAVLGLAEDGGWWALGLRRAAPHLVDGVPTSRADTGALQRARLVDGGLRVVDLPVLRDVDTIDDARAVAGLAPGTRFAALVGELDAEPVGA